MKEIVRLIILLLLLSLVPVLCELKAEITDDKEFDDFTAYYYLNPQPDKIPQALKYFLKSSLFRGNINTNDHVIEMVSYFFGRVANINPHLVREYEKYYDSEYN